jgi:enoyl-CoA hydratase
VSTIEIERVSDAVRVVRLNRPDRLNAMNFQLIGDLHDALDMIAGDEACKVAVLTGSGRAFCAGLDLKDYGEPPAVGAHRFRYAGSTFQSFIADLTLHMRATPQLLVAAVNGAAFGGGLSLSLACDLRVASRDASFCSAFVKTGLTGTDIAVTYLLPRLIGAARAFDMIVTGRTVDAEAAERFGIVSRLYDDGPALLDGALALAEEIAARPGSSLRATKEVMWANLDTPNMAACISLENRNQLMASANPEVQAFMADYAARITR